MRKNILTFAIVSVLLIAAGIFIWPYARGLKPVVTNPPQDIATIFDQANQPAENTTGLPLKIPSGFSISIFARDLGKPRVLAFDANATLLVSIPEAGKIVALPNNNGDDVADRVVTVASGLNRPHGLAFADPDTLLVAETNQVVSFKYNRDQLTVTDKKKLFDLPGNGGHSTRTIMFLPPPRDNILLVAVGSSCNVCRESDPRRAAILAWDGRELKPYATGLRNSVFQTIRPGTDEIWATEMGRDYLGDTTPPDEINIIKNEGSSTGSGENLVVPNFGWPICYGNNIHDTQFDRNTYVRNPCQEPTEIPSHIDIPAHSAPLGLAFVPPTGGEWPAEYKHNLLVAYHGSWNRSVPTGYKVVRYKLDAAGKYLGEEDFITGWLTKDNRALGRPVDILISPGGMMYISDDKAGVIYRVAPIHPSAKKDCVVTGCSGEVCADTTIMTACIYKEEFACYKTAKCERQSNGACGWTQTAELKACLKK